MLLGSRLLAQGWDNFDCYWKCRKKVYDFKITCTHSSFVGGPEIMDSTRKFVNVEGKLSFGVGDEQKSLDTTQSLEILPVL